ncbi:hypothetical protein TURU_162253 [Turdus rufiventris]|nr:hypothetical protein TURU_162253 [Turdus rufiventris]
MDTDGQDHEYSEQRVVGHWNRFPGEVVTAPSLTEFKKHLDGDLGVIPGDDAVQGWELDSMILWVPSNSA